MIGCVGLLRPIDFGLASILPLVTELLCNFNWGVFWSAVQACAIIVASIIAFFQLSAFRRNERIKATLPLLDELSLVEWRRRIDRFVPNHDYPKLRRENYDQIKQHHPTGDPKDEWMADFLFVCQFFERVGTLYSEGVIDRRLYMESFHRITMEFYMTLHDAMIWYWQQTKIRLPRFRRLAIEAEKYLRNARLPGIPAKMFNVSALPKDGYSPESTANAAPPRK